ncbi:MAG: DUF362 domain-containing protein, partial [Candidatus Auribacterota bacterium]|nr:DUF362 domain-containing protein [Candidatus Auribacterota bacterium]
SLRYDAERCNKMGKEELINFNLRDNPLLKSPTRPRVYVTRGEGPYANTRAALGELDLSSLHGKRVLLKPNAGRIAPPGSGVITDPRVVAAAIDTFKEAGAEIAVGESPIVGVRAFDAFDAIGITRVAEERGCRCIDLDARPSVKVPVPEGLAINSLQVCPEVLEYDFIVSIPVMKTHMHTGVTLAIKNMKGCLWRRSKVAFHMLPPVEGSSEKSINVAIADMSGVLRPDLSIIDGTVGMEGMGPAAGEAKQFGVIVVSADGFAADAVACGLMGTRAEDVPYLRIGAGRGYGVIDLEKIAVNPENWRDWILLFAPPPENLTIEFPGINILDKNSCSGCQSTLFLFLKRYGADIPDYFPKGAFVNFAIGKGHSEVPPGTVCVGNCTARHRDRGIFIPGCPPVGSEILHGITGEPSIDRKDGRVDRKKS